MHSQFLLILCLWLSTLLALGQPVKVFYVSQSGNDNHSGSKTSPFLTLKKATQAARNLRAIKGFTGPITIFLRKGNYNFTERFSLSSQDSGTSNAVFTISGYPGEKVVISNALRLNTESWKPLSTSAVKRLHPNIKAGDIFEIDILPLNLSQAKRFSATNSFTQGWPSIDFFAGDNRQPISQWPNVSQIVNSKNDPGWATTNGARDVASFYYADGGRPQDQDVTNELDLDGTMRSIRWRNALQDGYQLWVKGFWRVPWEPVTSRIRSMDSSGIQLYDQPVGGMGSKYSAIGSKDPLWRVGSGRENYKLLNALEEIDTPGEWALDIKDQKIYYYPLDLIAKLQLQIAVKTEPVVTVENARFIQIKDLWISGGLSNGIYVKDSRYITIAGCNVYNVGSSGIKVDGGDNNLLQSNTIFQTGASGVEWLNQGNRKLLIPSASRLINNYIHHTGNLSFTEGILVSNSVGMHVSHNLLHDLPKSAVRADSINDCIFEYNEIHNIALQESDNGAFYNYGGWSTYGNIFRYNFIHHINRSNGLYCDDGDSGDLFYSNIIHDAIEAIKFGGGHDNIASGNLIINSKSQSIDDRGINRNYILGSAYEFGLLQMNPLQDPWKSYGKRLVTQYGLPHSLWHDVLKPGWHPQFPHGCIMQDNVAIHSGPFMSPENGNILIYGNVAIDSVNLAGFYDYEAMDLRTDNPVILSKIPDLNQFLPKIGLYQDTYRKYLPSPAQTGGLVNRAQGGNLANEDQFIENKPELITH